MISKATVFYLWKKVENHLAFRELIKFMQQYNKKVLEKILAKATKGKKKKDRNERFRKGDKSSLK